MIVKELVARLGIKTDDKGQKKAEGGLKKVVALAKLAVAAFAAIKTVKWLKGVIEEVAALGDQFDKMAKRSGMVAATLQGLDHAAELSGTSLASVETAIKKLQKSQVEADDGMSEYVDEFKRMGVTVRDEKGNLKDTTDLFIEMADGIKNLDTDAERTAVAMSLLGRSGTQLIPMFNEGSDAIREMMQEMKDLGGIMSDEMVQDSADYIDNQRRMNVVIMGIKNSIAKDLLPQINKLTNGFINWWKANGKIIRQRIGVFFTKFGQVLLKNIKFFAGLARTVGKFISKLSPMKKKIAGIGVAVTLLGALLMGGPIGKFLLLITIIGLLIEDFQIWKEGGRSAIGAIMEKFGDFLGIDLTYDQWISDMGLFADGVGSIFEGIANGVYHTFRAIGHFFSDVWAGETEKAWENFGNHMLLIWDKFLPEIQKGLDALGIDFDISLKGMVEGFVIWMVKLRAIGNKIWREFIGDIQDGINQIKDAIPDWLKIGKGTTEGKPSPKLKGAGALAGGARATGGTGAAPTMAGRTSQSLMNWSPQTSVEVNLQGGSGMSPAKVGGEVVTQITKANEKERRTAMRALTSEPA